MSTGCSSLKRTLSGKKRRRPPIDPHGKRRGRGNDRRLENEEDVADVKVVLKNVQASCKHIKKEVPKVLYGKDPEVSRQKTEESVRTIRRHVDNLHELIGLPEFETEREIRLKEDKRSLQKEIDRLERENRKVRDLHVQKEERGSGKTQAQIDDVKLKEKKKSLEGQVQRFQAEITELQEEKAKTENENRKSKEEKVSLETKVDELQQELSKTQDLCYKEKSQLQADLNRLNDKLNAEVKAKEHALNRLSEIAAVKLKDNNPNITDLSDPNRPLKVAEKMIGLYDDEWTDAIEGLEEKNVEEEEGIKILLQLLTETFTVCQQWSTDQITSMRSLLAYPKFPDEKTELKDGNKKKRKAPPPPNPFTGEIDDNSLDDSHSAHSENSLQNEDEVPDPPQELMKNIKDHRKDVAGTTIPKVQKVVFSHLKHTLSLDEEKLKICEPYVERCAELCWYMLIQDPPLDLVWNHDHGDRFPSQSFKAFTKTGSKVNYVVWPALYLFQGGSLLSKGVCQGME